MKLPHRKGGPKLPPPPQGGGAAARQRQFQMERGLPIDPPLESCDPPKQDDETPSDPEKRTPKPRD